MTKIGDHDAFFRAVTDGPWASPDDPGHRVGAALRRLATIALAGTPDDATLERLAEQLEALTPATDAEAVGSRYRDEDRPPPDGSRSVQPNGNGTHPLCGPRNPIAPPIRLRMGDGVVFCDVVYDVRFEGLPGLVQGGFIAAAFDIMLGQGVAISGQGGVTGSLSVKYLAPTPLYRPLVYEGRFDRLDGRKTFARATLRTVAEGTLCAEAEGVFISPRGPIGGAI
jgi:acyl-coenzyme A thioesterase PaaI-like protein